DLDLAGPGREGRPGGDADDAAGAREAKDVDLERAAVAAAPAEDREVAAAGTGVELAIVAARRPAGGDGPVRDLGDRLGRQAKLGGGRRRRRGRVDADSHRSMT